MWTKNDERFLRSMRITWKDPPPRLPRFRVELSAVDGVYDVIDELNAFSAAFAFGKQDWPDPRAAAEDWARQLNEKHVARE